MEVKTWVFAQPNPDLWVIMRPIIVKDHMNIQVLGRLPVDLPQELAELHIAMPGIACTNDFAF